MCGMNVRPGDSECRVPSLLSPPVLCNLFSVHLHAQLYASVHAYRVTGLRKITLLHHSQLFADIVIMFTVYTNVHLCIMHSCTIVYTRFNRFSQCTLVYHAETCIGLNLYSSSVVCKFTLVLYVTDHAGPRRSKSRTGTKLCRPLP